MLTNNNNTKNFYVGEISDGRIVELCDWGRPLHRLVRAVAEAGIFATLRWWEVTEMKKN